MPQDGNEQTRFQSDERDEFIPVRKSDIVGALTERGALRTAGEQESFRQLCRLLGSIFHYEYYDRLEKLRDDYYYFSPDLPAEARFDAETVDRAHAELVETLIAVLKGANYVEIPLSEVQSGHKERRVFRVEIKISTDDYREVRFFRRGHHKEPLSFPTWFGLRTRLVDTWVYDNVIIMVTIKPKSEVRSKRQLRRLVRDHLRPGSILIKYFRNIPYTDLSTLFPRVRVVMSLFDKLVLGVPAVAGGITLLVNLLPTLTVLLVVVGFYLGFVGTVAQDDIAKALAAVTGLAALGGLIMRQRLKYERRSLKYQKQISDNVYFRNVSNNAGIFDYIIGAAEEQECKEAFLAYYFLLTAREPPDQRTLDVTVERWLKDTFGVDVDFEVDDALAKLERLRLLRRAGERLSVLPLKEALVVLDEAWDNFFPYANEGRGARATRADAV
jgi:hypothetical protein